MPRSEASGIFGECEFGRNGERGAALPTVLAVILLLLVFAASVANQAKSELKAARLEKDILQVHSIVTSAMDKASLQAWSDPKLGKPENGTVYPDPQLPKPESSIWRPCEPQPLDPANSNGAQYCVDYLKRNDTVTLVLGNSNLRCGTDGFCALVPVRIRYQLTKTDQIRALHGWVVMQFTDINKTNVANVRTYFDHRWCRDGGAIALCG